MDSSSRYYEAYGSTLKYRSMEVIVENIYHKIRKDREIMQQGKTKTQWMNNRNMIRHLSQPTSPLPHPSWYRKNVIRSSKMTDKDFKSEFAKPVWDLLDESLRPAPILIFARLQGTNRDKIKHVPTYGGNLQVPIPKIIKAVDRIPKVKSWALISRNYRAYDEAVLHNRPYLDDSSAEDDSVYHDLGVLFDGKIHGQRQGDYDYMNDDIFVNLVDAIKSYLQNVPKDFRNTDEDVDNSEIVPKQELVFNVVANIFPDLGTPSKLLDKYFDLTSERKNKITKDRTNNIDGDDAESVLPTRSLHSYRQLFCRRCYKYDCETHPPEVDVHPGPSSTTRKGPEFRSTLPCGHGCYIETEIEDNSEARGSKSSESSRNGSPVSPSKAKNEVSPMDDDAVGSSLNVESLSLHPVNSRAVKKFGVDVDRDLCEAVRPDSITKGLNYWNEHGVPQSTFVGRDIWTNGEKSMARVLLNVYPNNYCAVAQTLITKTCKEVYKFAQNDEMTKCTKRSMNFEKPTANSKNKYGEWRKHYLKMKIKDKGDALYQYIPCDHPGQKCEKANFGCRCAQSSSQCEKFCLCSSDCLHRFPGCTCSKKCNTSICPCFKLERECDPDICRKCNAGKLEPDKRTCRNVSIQNGEHAETLMAKSKIKDAGWGLFSATCVEKDSLVSEYCGEIISHNESEKRGIVYDKQKLSYIYNLNDYYCVDATRKGNKIRFANHSNNPNCYPKIMKVNGDHRIGIFAKRNINPGEELFFDYGDNFVKTQNI